MNPNGNIEIPSVWIFAEYFSGDFYPTKPFNIELFFDHEEMKEFSANRSSTFRPVHPKYVSMYWKLDLD